MSSDRQRSQARKALARIARKHPIAALAAVVVLLACSAAGLTGAGGLLLPGAPAASGPAAFESLADGLEPAEVVRVVDGDTLKVRLEDGVENYVRLVGVDTPESVASDETRNCEEGVIASDFAKSLVAPGQIVWLQRDVSDVDRYGRWLRYVWLEQPSDPSDEDQIAGKMLNAVLVQEGYAQVKRYKPDTTLHDVFDRWGDEAIAAGKGVTRKWA